MVNQSFSFTKVSKVYKKSVKIGNNSSQLIIYSGSKLGTFVFVNCMFPFLKMFVDNILTNSLF